MSMIFQLFAIPDSTAVDLMATPAKIRSVLASLDDADSGLSLEKSWHGLHYLLTGDSMLGDPPLNFLLADGNTVGDEDVGYGPARIVDSRSVSSIDQALAAFTDADFEARLDLQAMDAAQIYPNIWGEPRDQLKQEYTGYLDALKAYVHQTSATGQSLLLALR